MAIGGTYVACNARSQITTATKAQPNIMAMLRK